MSLSCSFLQYEEKRIYCNEYIAHPGIRKNHGVFICKPIWGERIRTSRILHNLSMFLQNKGFDVFTCDYYGDGNSFGESHELNFTSMIRDMVALEKYYSEKYSSEAASIIGLRIGANCALEFGRSIKNLKATILIEPLFNILEYLKDGLRSNLTSQMTLYKKIIKTREVLIEEIRNDVHVNIDGFVIGKALWDSFETVGSLVIDNGYKGFVLVISMNQNDRINEQYKRIINPLEYGVLKVIPQEFIWTGWKFYEPKPIILMNTIADFLDNIN